MKRCSIRSVRLRVSVGRVCQCCAVTSDETPPGQDDSDWESRLRAAAESGDVLDLAEGASVDPAKAASWPPERTVPAAALRALLTADDLHVDPKGLRIRAARFEELLDLEFVHFPHPLHLSYCALEAGMDTSGAQLGELSLDHAHAEGEVRTIMATIDGQLNLSGATLDNPGGIALAIDGAKVGGDVFADKGFQAQGEVRANGATIDGSLNLSGATLDYPGGDALNLESATVGRLFLPGCVDGALTLVSATIGDLVTPAAELPPGPVVATGWKVGDLHGLLREDWRAVHAWLSGTPASKNSDESGPIAVQPWHALADVYDRNGNPAGARRLRLEAAKQVTRQSPWATKLLRTVYFLVARNGYYPLWAAMWLMFVLAAAVLLVAVNREDIAPTDRDTAKTAVEQHFGIDPDATDAAPAVRAQADMFLPVTAETPCEVHPGYPCMNSLTFAINAVLPPAASANRDWDIASDATLALSAGLPLLKLMSWALAALLLAGVTGLLRKN